MTADNQDLGTVIASVLPSIEDAAREATVSGTPALPIVLAMLLCSYDIVRHDSPLGKEQRIEAFTKTAREAAEWYESKNIAS